MSNILVTQEDDGSQWVSLEDYRALQSKFSDFLDNVYDIVSVQCNDVGEAHAGLQEEVITIRKSGSVYLTAGRRRLRADSLNCPPQVTHNR